MQIPQLSYSYAPPAAVAGQLATTSTGKETSTGLAEAACSAGLFLVGGTATYQVKKPALSGDVTGKLRGVACYVAVKEPVGPVGGPYLPNFKAGDAVPVLKKGQVWVPVAAADVADDAIPYVIFSGDDAGKIRGTTDASAVQPTAGVKVIQGAAAGCLALVDLNLP